MNEDQDRTRLGHGPQNLSVPRHMALNTMQQDPSKDSLRGKLQRAAWNDAYLAKVLALISTAICSDLFVRASPVIAPSIIAPSVIAPSVIARNACDGAIQGPPDRSAAHAPLDCRAEAGSQ